MVAAGRSEARFIKILRSRPKFRFLEDYLARCRWAAATRVASSEAFSFARTRQRSANSKASANTKANATSNGVDEHPVAEPVDKAQRVDEDSTI